MTCGANRIYSHAANPDGGDCAGDLCACGPVRVRGDDFTAPALRTHVRTNAGHARWAAGDPTASSVHMATTGLSLGLPTLPATQASNDAAGTFAFSGGNGIAGHATAASGQCLPGAAGALQARASASAAAPRPRPQPGGLSVS
ncbi:hypothetical protein PRJ39_14985 [Lysobacter enzymogenes]|uniref:hypothetical protein n=1 Tax=Lysobacter enzymogenes TaxID=69 RepID=UPI00374A29EC